MCGKKNIQLRSKIYTNLDGKVTLLVFKKNLPSNLIRCKCRISLIKMRFCLQCAQIHKKNRMHP